MTAPLRKVVVISPTPALWSPSHAGGLLLSRIVESHHAKGAKLRVLTPSTPPSLAELSRTSPRADTCFLGRPRDHRGARRGVLTLVHRLVPLLARYDPYLPWPPLVVEILLDPKLRRLLRSADVIDLQWEEYGRLAPLLRRLAGQAAIVCMFHDVNDQRAARSLEACTDRGSARRARRIQRRTRAAERRMASALDVAFVLSSKDEQLLASVAPSAPTVIVAPPIVDASTPLANVSSRGPVLGFVSSLGRPENRTAAERLVSRIWPRIRAAVPHAQLVLVGGGLDDRTADEFTAVPGVEVTGFIDDLEPAYARFRATMAPIQNGAGVKFKVVESIVRGIPTLTTTVGAEGIDSDLLTLISDDDAELADGAVAALRDPSAAERAFTAAPRAREAYGAKAFGQAYQAAVSSAAATRASTV